MEGIEFTGGQPAGTDESGSFPSSAAHDATMTDVSSSPPPVPKTSANDQTNYYKRAQEEANKKKRGMVLGEIKSDADRINNLASSLEKKIQEEGRADFNEVSMLLSNHQAMMARLRESDLPAYDMPIEVSSARARTLDIFNKWKSATKSDAVEHGMENDIPNDLDAMLTNGTVLQSNQRVLQLFSKAMRNTASAKDQARVNQRDLEAESEKIRQRKLASQSRGTTSGGGELKRPRPSDVHAEDEESSAKKEKITPFEPIKSRVFAMHSTPILEAIVMSSRASSNEEVKHRPLHSNVKEMNAIKKRWRRIAETVRFRA
jgi:hypothetical protein